MTAPHSSPVSALTSRHRRTRSTVVRVLAPVALCVAFGAGTVACGGNDEGSASDAADELAEKLAESGNDDADVDIDSESGQVDVSTPDGDMSFGDGTELPDDFPSDIPLPEGYALTSSMSNADGDSSNWSITGTLPDADDSTFDDLVAEFTSAGWTKSSDASSETGGGTASTAMLDNGTWQVLVSTQVGVEGMPDSFTYVVSPASS